MFYHLTKSINFIAYLRSVTFWAKPTQTLSPSLREDHAGACLSLCGSCPSLLTFHFTNNISFLTSPSFYFDQCSLSVPQLLYPLSIYIFSQSQIGQSCLSRYTITHLTFQAETPYLCTFQLTNKISPSHSRFHPQHIAKEHQTAYKSAKVAARDTQPQFSNTRCLRMASSWPRSANQFSSMRTAYLHLNRGLLDCLMRETSRC